MVNTLKQIFGFGPKVDFRQLVKEGAVIIDVRSKGEFAGGHIEGSINIPVNILDNNLNRLKDKQRCVITCCASGMRSRAAKNMLESSGYTKVYNGGGWYSLQQKIK